MSLVIHETSEGERADSVTSQDIKSSATAKKGENLFLLFIYIACSVVGSIGGPMLQRLYYNNGGTRKWLSSWLQSVGFFITIPIISFLYVKSCWAKTLSQNPFFMDLKLVFSIAFVGLVLGFDNYMYSAGLSYIPVSTSSLLFSTQLAFTAFFAFFIVKQKFTFYTINAVIVMTFAAVVLALHTSGDRPPGVSRGEYLFGFFFTLGGAALWGLGSPLIELCYTKSSNPITYLIVFQVQVVMNFSAAMFATVGMLVNRDFKVIPREAREFGLGEKSYYALLVGSALVWQLSSIGIMGVISCTSSLFTGILSSFLLPMTEVAAIIAFKEKFTGEKGLSLALCLWGFTSYFVGDYKKSGKAKPNRDHITRGDERTRPSTDIESPSQVQMRTKY